MRHRFDPWVRKIPWRRAWQPTPVFLPGESHGQRSLAGNEHPSLSPSDWNSLEEACLEGKDGFREIQSESLVSPTTRGP